MTIAGPLAGRRVVVTQAVHQAPELAGLLEGAGATALLYPCIAIEPPADTRALDQSLRDLAAGRYDWLVLTSANTVRVLDERAQALGLPPAAWNGVQMAAIGAATDEAIAAWTGRRAALSPGESTAEGLARSLLDATRPGQRLLLPQAEIARPVLLHSLLAAGLEVAPVVAYQTVPGTGGVDLAALLALSPPAVDAITFTSSSTVRNLLWRLEREGGDCMPLAHTCLAAIGPITAQTVLEAGFQATVVASQQSVEGLVQALIDYWTII